MTLLWYDLETFGPNPRYDRIAQFAALRTDEQFNALEDPIVLYGRLSPDYLPDPTACLIAGITPQELNQKGLPEAELLRQINIHFSRPGTCALGFNSIRFDDEFIRNLYYRNFHNPFRREWAEGNSRWDILDMVSATRDLRPEGINWPQSSEGKPTVKLALLTRCNSLTHNRAHEALSDVYATIDVAKLIHDNQPRLFEWAFKHRTRDKVQSLINLTDRTPLVHTSSLHYSATGNTTLICPLLSDPENRNLLHSFDLRFDPEPLFSLQEDEIRRRIYTPAAELAAEGVERIAIKSFAINKSPFLAPQSILSDKTADRLGINLTLALTRWERLRNDVNLINRLHRVFSVKPEWGKIDDPDFQIYERFFPDEDRSVLEQISTTPPKELAALNIQARDSRIPEMLRRYIGRNYPEALDESERKLWKSFCASRILFPPISGAPNLSEYRERLAALRDSSDLDAEKKSIIRALEDYGNWLEKEILHDELRGNKRTQGVPGSQTPLIP